MTPGPAQGHQISTRHRGTRVFFQQRTANFTVYNRLRQQTCFVPGEWCKNLKGQEKQIIFRIMTQKKTTQISINFHESRKSNHGSPSTWQNSSKDCHRYLLEADHGASHEAGSEGCTKFFNVFVTSMDPAWMKHDETVLESWKRPETT
jgi:hypothetical protein